MVSWLIALNLVLLLALGLAVARIERLYRKHRHRSLWQRSRLKIPAVPVTDLDPVFAPGLFGATRATEVRLIGGNVAFGPDPHETWILAVLAKQSRRMFEFGTCTGRTAYLWAANSPPEARITTITLHPNELQAYQGSAEDRKIETKIALHESCFATFFYSETDVEYKIDQRFGDSKALDDAPLQGQFDLVFVDGSHAYSYVASDTDKALRMLRPGGLLLWHDYRGPSHSEGVFRFLNELSERLPLGRIEGTSLVYYRKPEVAADGRAQAA
jgi:hypothetical protein